jgi:hypothetical protein
LKRTATEILRRGFENVVANWPLLLIRIVEGVVMLGVVIVSVIAIVIPFVVKLGLGKFDVHDADEAYPMLLALLSDNWMLLLYALGAATLMLGVLVAVHSFVEAGSARIYLDGENAAGPAAASRAQLRAFRVDRWLEGARRGWWTVFWIYNATWGIAGLIMIAPLVVLLPVVLLLRGSNAAAITVGCLGGAITALIFIVTIFVTNVWTMKSIVVALHRDEGTAPAIRDARRDLRTDFGRHFAVAFVILMITFGGSCLFALMSSGIHFRHDSAPLALLFAPMQIASSLANTVFSTAMGAWFLASFAALAAERRP